MLSEDFVPWNLQDHSTLTVSAEDDLVGENAGRKDNSRKHVGKRGSLHGYKTNKSDGYCHEVDRQSWLGKSRVQQRPR